MDIDKLIIEHDTEYVISSILNSSALENRILERARMTPVETITYTNITVNYYELLYKARLARFDISGAIEACLSFIYSYPTYLDIYSLSIPYAHEVLELILEFHAIVLNLLDKYPETICRLSRTYHHGEGREATVSDIKTVISKKQVEDSAVNFAVRLALTEDERFKNVGILTQTHNLAEVGAELIELDHVDLFCSLCRSEPSLFDELAPFLAKKYCETLDRNILNQIDRITSHTNPYVIFLQAVLDFNQSVCILDIGLWCSRHISKELICKVLCDYNRRDEIDQWLQEYDESL